MAVYLTPYLMAQVACLAASFRYLHGTDRETRRWQGHRGYLALVVAVEVAAVALRDDPAGNHLLYNLYLPVEGLFVGGFLYRLLRPMAPRRVRYGYLAAGLAVAAAYLGELALGGWGRLATGSVALLSLLLAAGGVLYLALLVRTDRGSPLWRHAPLWWAVGVAVFYLGTLLAVAGLPLLWASGDTVLGVAPYALVFGVSNAALYGAWIMAFVCTAAS